MFIYDIIEKKRKSFELTAAEIKFAVSAFVNKQISDAQMSSLLMAIVLNGMTFEETLNLTLAMRDFGDILKFDEVIADKHSTGGVSDSTTLLVVPICAHLGINMAKMSGRALGYTGGTIDKLEVFDGFNTQLSMEEFRQVIGEIGCSIISQTNNLAYADKLIYELRNATATVDSIPLIASSIMSKKLASGCKFLLLNVTYGTGAFMKTKRSAIKLAKVMVRIGNESGVNTKAVVSKMDTPLAGGVGCVYEVISALEALSGGESLLTRVSQVLASVIYTQVKGGSLKAAGEKVRHALKSGAALEKLAQLVERQGGAKSQVYDPNLILQSKIKTGKFAPKSGYVSQIDALEVAKIVKRLTDGAENKEHAKTLGVKIAVKLGQKVRKGDLLAEICHNLTAEYTELLGESLLGAFRITKTKKKQKNIIVKII